MPSTFSPSLRIELIASGEKSGTWGVFTNNNLGDLIEQAITGNTALDVTAGNITLTALNGVSDQSRSAVLTVIGTAGVTRVLTIPNLRKPYTVKNNADATVQVKTASGTAFNCPTNSESYIYCDGLDVVSGRSITAGANAITSLASPFNSPAFTGTPTAPTAGTGTNTTQVATTAFVNAEIASDTANLAPLNSPALTGVPTAPTATTGTNTTQLATTAYVVARVAQDAPTKTGTGASGTWDIAITGNAATATTATNATNASNAVTQSPGTNNTTIATTAFVQAALQAVYPVGSVYINADVGTDPSTLLGFGTWSAIGAGRVLVGQDVGDPLFDVLGDTGGSKDATLVAHSHTASGSGTTGTTSISHTHTFSGNTGEAGGHNHTVNDPSHNHIMHGEGSIPGGGFLSNNNNAYSGGGGSSFGVTAGVDADLKTGTATTGISLDAVGNHAHSFSGTTVAADPSHNHAFTFSGGTDTQGSAATNANLPPFLTVKMWKRTA
jgi:hypothetical protein